MLSLALILIGVAFEEVSGNKILDEILQHIQKRSVPSMRPGPTDSGLKVSVEFYLGGDHYVHEATGQASVVLFEETYWTDERLKWNESSGFKYSSGRVVQQHFGLRDFF